MTQDIKLPSGINLLIKPQERVHSISIGIFCRVGLADEPTKLNGISHFLEHMSFKGTPTRSAKKIAEEMDMMGGNINAQTSKEYTSFYIKILPQYLEKGLDLLLDLYVNSILDKEEIEKERGVILEEYNMYEDSPDENIHDLFAQTIWPNYSLGLPILGNKKSIKQIQQKDLQLYKQYYLNPKNTIISIAGQIKDSAINKIKAKIENSFAKISEFKERQKINTEIKPAKKIFLKHKKTEQTHISLGCPALKYADSDKYKALLLSTILGGSMSSRLFQEVREKHGLAYSIFSFLSFYEKTGLFRIYAGISTDKLKKSLNLIIKQLNKIKEIPVHKKELEKAKSLVKGSFLLDLEKTSSWMNWMAKSKMYLGKIESIDDFSKNIDKVNIYDIQNIAKKLLNLDKFAFASIGPFNDKDLSFNEKSFTEYMNSL